MTTQLFLLQFHVGKIFFEPIFPLTPTKKQIGIRFRFSTILDMDIDVAGFPLAGHTDKGETIDYNLGMSHLFCHSPQNLFNELKANPLEITLVIDEVPVGSGKVKWKHEFMETVKRIDNVKSSKSNEYSCRVDLYNESSEMICKLELVLRISGFGDSVETQFQIQKVAERYKYTFKSPHMENTFKCKRIKSEDLGTVYSVFNPVVSVTNQGSKPDVFFAGRRSSRMSQQAAAATGVVPLTEIFQHNSGDTVSMCYHTNEAKFFDWLNFMSIEAGNMEKDDEDEKLENPVNITADQINSQLCGHKDCPGVKLFKELGMGPLATERAMLDEDVEVPIQAGLSHIYRKMSAHGPYGKFCRPKRLDEPFIPSKNALETRRPPCPNRKEEKCKAISMCPCCTPSST